LKCGEAGRLSHQTPQKHWYQLMKVHGITAFVLVFTVQLALVLYEERDFCCVD